MATIQDFINSYLQINSLLLQREAEKRQQMTAKTLQLSSLTNIAQLDPSSQGALAQLGEDLGVGSQDALLAIWKNLAPGQGVIERTAEKRGYESATAAERAEMERQAASRATTGARTAQRTSENVTEQVLTSGAETADKNLMENLGRASLVQQFAGGPVNFALGQLPQERLGIAALIQSGLQMSAPQQAQLGLGYAQLEQQGQIAAAQNALGYAQLASQSALGEAEAANRLKIAQIGAAARGGEGGMSPTQIFDQLKTLIPQLEDTRATLSQQPGLLRSHVATINALIDSLNKQTGTQIPLLDETEVLNSGRLEGLENLLYNIFGEGGDPAVSWQNFKRRITSVR